MASVKHPLSALEGRLVALADGHEYKLARDPVKNYCVLEHVTHGVTVYLNRQRTPRNTIAVFIHPDTDLRRLHGVLGLEIPDARCHSAGMSRFPRKINDGKGPSTYGYSIVCADLSSFGRLLDSLL